MMDVRMRWVSLALVGLFLTTGMIGLTGAGYAAHGLPAPHAGAVPFAAAVAPRPAGPPTTHGDLVVSPANSPYTLSPLTTGATTYFQEGNITVLPGGRLYVDSLTLSFLQFVGTTGNIGQRASHLYNFTVEGLVVLNNSVLTTNATILNAYVKLTVNVTNGGTLVANASTLAFPGWVMVNGPTSRLYANESRMIPNPAVPGLVENTALLHDTEYSPGLSVNNGARVVLTHSVWSNYYSDNVSMNGPAGVNLTAPVDSQLGGGASLNVSNLAVAQPTAPSLALALGYNQWAAATIAITYYAAAPIQIGDISVWYHGVKYTAGTNVMTVGQAPNTTGTLLVPVPNSFVHAVNGSGTLNLLQSTSQFGGGSTLNVSIKNPSSAISLGQVRLVIQPVYGYNMQLAGQSNITVADSLLDLNWNALPGTILDAGLPPAMAWDSNKLLLQGGSQSYFANVSVPTTYDTVFDNQSVVVPLDTQSAAFFYRWGLVQAQSGAFGPIPQVRVVAYPAYNATESNNATGLALNNLSSADPDLSAYVQSWYPSHGDNVGVSDLTGDAQLLLISSIVRQGDLPTGLFLGSYHIGSQLPGDASGSIKWQYGAVTAYPLGMNPSGPDGLPVAQYPNYRAELSIPSVGLAVNGTASLNASAAIGDPVTFTVPVENVGTAALVNFTVSFAFDRGAPKGPLQIGPSKEFAQLNAGETQVVTFNWTVNQSVIGLGGVKQVTFLFSAAWNGGVQPIGGVATTGLVVTMHPSPIAIHFYLPSGPYVVQNSYSGSGTVAFAGNGSANVTATLIGSGGTFEIGFASVPRGTFTLNLGIVPGVQAGQNYQLQVVAAYNGAKGWDNFTNFAIAAAPAPAPAWYDVKVLGPVTVWMLLVAAIAAALGTVGFLVATGRFARGKLVECGECGSLIPEEASACPKCGAEFENDLVRCSRCGSTIAANAQVCPECAAQLLGTPVPESKDPERAGYADFVERFRTEAKKELADNYGEGAFWDWWKRQPSFVSFNQWKLQQSAATRAGMTAPIVTAHPDDDDGSMPAEAPPTARPGRRPPTSGPGGSPSPTARGISNTSARTATPGGAAPPAARSSAPPQPTSGVGAAAAVAPVRRAPAPGPTPPGGAPASAGSQPFSESESVPTPGLRACSNCSKEIPTDFLVCPFCGSVTR